MRVKKTPLAHHLWRNKCAGAAIPQRHQKTPPFCPKRGCQRQGLLAALGKRQEVSLWRFDADAEPLVTLPRNEAANPHRATTAGEANTSATAPPESPADWRAAVTPRGAETRLGEALATLLDREPGGGLAGRVGPAAGGHGIELLLQLLDLDLYLFLALLQLLQLGRRLALAAGQQQGGASPGGEGLKRRDAGHAGKGPVQLSS